MVSPWIDVSVTLNTGMVNWPGDPSVRFSHALDMQRGDPCTVSLLEMGAHTGTHMDAPAHFVRGGIGINDMPLNAAMGSARVIPIHDHESIKADELAQHAIRRGEKSWMATVRPHGPFCVQAAIRKTTKEKINTKEETI
jgi:arylformamidase